MKLSHVLPTCRVTLSPLDPGWVGAWWIGFVLSGVLLILTAIPLSLFPHELPGKISFKVGASGRETTPRLNVVD